MESTPVVTLLGKSNVLPATPTKKGHVFLSCLDLFWQNIHYNRRVIFYKTSPQDLSSAIETLKSSLSLVLVHYYHWAGRIAVGEDNRLVIDCNDLGVEFVEASINLPIRQFDEDGFEMKEFFDSLCQHLDSNGQHLYTSPLLSVQATRFSDGGLAVAIAMSHVVADGQSLWNFLVSWGECARGKALSLEPLHDRARLAVQHPSPEKAFLKFEEGDVEIGISTGNTRECLTVEKDVTANSDAQQPTAKTPENGTVDGKTTEESKQHDETDKDRAERSEADSSEATPTIQAVFHLSGASIKILKSEAAATTGKNFSSLVVLFAHFWQRIAIARQRPSTEIAGGCVMMNFRNRVMPPLPPEYFGNVITFTLVNSNAGTIAGESLGAIASRIKAAINASDLERLRGLMNWLELNNNQIFPRIKFHGSIASVSSSPHFPAYAVDFGWGNPAAVRSAKVEGNGELVLFGGRPGSQPGDVEICICLSSDVMDNLRNDPHFLATSPGAPN